MVNQGLINWFWCPGNLNPADLLTRSGTNCAQVNSEFWLNGSFLPQNKSSWPIIPCSSITSGEVPIQTVNLVKLSSDNPSREYILSLLHHTQSLSTLIRALNLIHKVCRSWRDNPARDRVVQREPTATWNSIKASILSSVLKCFTTESALIIANNKMKHLVIQLVDGVYYVSDRSFRSRIGVPLICKKTILAKCILSDAHTDLGHGRDVLQVLTHIQTSFFIPGIRKMITALKKSCPGCIKLNKIPFAAFEADVPDVLKSIQPPFSYCQADIFGPVFAQKDGTLATADLLVEGAAVADLMNGSQKLATQE